MIVAVTDGLPKALKKLRRKTDKAELHQDLKRHEYHQTRRERRRAREYRAAIQRAKAANQERKMS